MSTTVPPRRIPFGAELVPGGTHFRVWAPAHRRVELHIEGSAHRDLEPEDNGWHHGLADAPAGTRYSFRLDHSGKLFADPGSRFQPDGPEGASEVIDPSGFAWTDAAWAGVRAQGQVIYEMHIGTFTREGTFAAATAVLEELRDTGITVLEVMPVAEWAGRFGWGYDGVSLFAPTSNYGRPDDFRAFVDRAHALGLAVILDVVYNHLGPRGNCLPEFAPDYFTDRYHTDWGKPINYDGENSEPVREFFTSNAVYWIREFHLDGLRLDATQNIFDSSPEHIVAEIARKAREAAGGRSILIVAENEPQDADLVRPQERGGWGLDMVWNDDFHHTAMVALTGRTEAYYTDYLGTPQELISTAKWGFLYQGQYYTWQRKRRGTPALDVSAGCFVDFLQNHDQVANRVLGRRAHTIAGLERYRAVMALLLLGPATPMLFQGQEFCSSSPFHYFADHEERDLADQVRSGRREFLAQFRSLEDPGIEPHIPDPSDPRTFEMCKLDPAERRRNAPLVRFHRDLLRLRREDPVFRAQDATRMHGAILGPEAFVLRFVGEDGDDRLLLVNLGRDLHLTPAPEPLLAPPAHTRWKLLWSSEDPAYGGSGTPEPECRETTTPVREARRFELPTTPHWRIQGHAAVVVRPVPRRSPHE